MVPWDFMVSNSNKWAAKNTRDIEIFDGGVNTSGGRGAIGYFCLNLWRCRTPVLYVVFVDGARASLYKRQATMAMSVSPIWMPNLISSENTPVAREL